MVRVDKVKQHAGQHNFFTFAKQYAAKHDIPYKDAVEVETVKSLLLIEDAKNVLANQIGSVENQLVQYQSIPYPDQRVTDVVVYLQRQVAGYKEQYAALQDRQNLLENSRDDDIKSRVGEMLQRRRPLEIKDSESVETFIPTKYQKGQQGQPVYVLPAPKKTEVPKLLQIEDAMQEAKELLSDRTPLAIEDGRPASVAEKEPVESVDIGGVQFPVAMPTVSKPKKIGTSPTKKPVRVAPTEVPKSRAEKVIKETDTPKTRPWDELPSQRLPAMENLPTKLIRKIDGKPIRYDIAKKVVAALGPSAVDAAKRAAESQRGPGAKATLQDLTGAIIYTLKNGEGMVPETKGLTAAVENHEYKKVLKLLTQAAERVKPPVGLGLFKK